MEKIPAYRKLYKEIKREIQSGKLSPGVLLPSESELEHQFSVSRTTVRKAIGLLSSEGYLHVQQGRGTEVLDVSTTQRLNSITSISEALTEKGFTVTTQGMYIELITAPDFVREALKLSDEAKVYKLQRVQCADGNPIAIINNYLIESIVPNLEKHTEAFTKLYQLLEKEYGIAIRHAWEYISAISADFTESQILRIPVGSPLLFTKRISYTDTIPFEYSINKLVADKYEYSVYMEGRTQTAKIE